MNEETNPNAWVITDVFSKTGVRITIKASGGSLNAAIDNLYEGMKHGIATHAWTTEQAGAPKKVDAPISQTTSPAPVTAPASKAVVDTGINTLEVVKLEVTPKPDNKVELKLYGAGHKYPDLYHNGAVEQVLNALSLSGFDFTADHMRVAQTFDVNFFADWRNSEKLNKNNVPYKNVVGYRAIDAVA